MGSAASINTAWRGPERTPQRELPWCVHEPAVPDIEGKKSALFLCGIVVLVFTPQETSANLRPAMPKRIVYLCRGKRTRLLSQEIADGEGVRSHFTAIKLPYDVDVETALRMVQAEFPDYDIRVLKWHLHELDYAPPD
jgi:hypothetical protein